MMKLKFEQIQPGLYIETDNSIVIVKSKSGWLASGKDMNIIKSDTLFDAKRQICKNFKLKKEDAKNE